MAKPLPCRLHRTGTVPTAACTLASAKRAVSSRTRPVAWLLAPGSWPGQPRSQHSMLLLPWCPVATSRSCRAACLSTAKAKATLARWTPKECGKCCSGALLTVTFCSAPAGWGPDLLLMNVDSVRWLAEVPAPEQPKTARGRNVPPSATGTGTSRRSQDGRGHSLRLSPEHSLQQLTCVAVHGGTHLSWLSQPVR